MSEFDWTMGSQKSGNNATEEADAGQGTSEVNFPSLAEAVSMAGGVKKTDTSSAGLIFDKFLFNEEVGGHCIIT